MAVSHLYLTSSLKFTTNKPETFVFVLLLFFFFVCVCICMCTYMHVCVCEYVCVKERERASRLADKPSLTYHMENAQALCERMLLSPVVFNTFWTCCAVMTICCGLFLAFVSNGHVCLFVRAFVCLRAACLRALTLFHARTLLLLLGCDYLCRYSIFILFKDAQCRTIA